MPPGGLVFGVLGDTPYNSAEVQRLDVLIDDMNQERLDFVVHVGDIGSGRLACSDTWLAARKRQFGRLKHTFVLIPGDNEWLDCRDAHARLEAWRALFCAPALAVEVQPGEYCEHMRWSTGGALFVTLNVPGHDNNLRDSVEHAHRMAAVLGWLDESAALAGQRGEAGYSNYAASKGGQISFTKSLAAELAPNIRVNSVAPGWVDTELNDVVFGDAPFKRKIVDTIPLGRVATADDIALAIVFLASDWAASITGEILNVNGGSVLCG